MGSTHTPIALSPVSVPVPVPAPAPASALAPVPTSTRASTPPPPLPNDPAPLPASASAAKSPPLNGATEAQFTTAAEQARSLQGLLSFADQGNLYKFFKQTTVGDINVECPWSWDMKGKAKWDAWNSVKGLSKEAARKMYVELVRDLNAKYRGGGR